jgi:hypothetical protein
VTARTSLAGLLGTGVGAGLLLVIMGARGTVPAGPSDPALTKGAHPRRLLTGPGLRRAGRAAAAGLLVLLMTRWIAAGLSCAALVLCWNRVFGGTRRAKLATARLDALAAWTESLRDLVATGIALPEALPASVVSAARSCSPR